MVFDHNRPFNELLLLPPETDLNAPFLAILKEIDGIDTFS